MTIWEENLALSAEKKNKSEKRVIEVLESVNFYPQEDARTEAVFCGYFRRGTKLEEGKSLLYIFKQDEFIEIDRSATLKPLKKQVLVEDSSLVEKIRKEVEEGLPMPPKKQSRRRFKRKEIRIPYLDLVDPSTPLAIQLETIVNRMTRLVESEVTMPVLISSIMVPSALVYNYPITVIYGKSGAGKSAITRLASEMFGVPLSGGSATYAGLRNHIRDCKYRTDDDTGETYEVNINLPVDDMKGKMFLEDENLHTMFRCGISQSTGDIRLSTSEIGNNITFNSACPKIISTCDDFWSNAKLHELKRRITIIETEFSPHLKSQFIDKEAINYNDGEVVDLIGAVENFWYDNQDKFSDFYAKAAKKGGEQKELIASMACAYDLSVDEAVVKVNAYNNFIRGTIDKIDPRDSYLDRYLSVKREEVLANNKKNQLHGNPIMATDICIKASEVKVKMREGIADGIFDSVNSEEINKLMKEKGFVLQSAGNAWFWKKPI